MDNPNRWKQRFENFERAYSKLFDILNINELSEYEKIALIKLFELNYELSWNVMKDYLEEEGFDPKSPKSTIRQALKSELISNEEWMDVVQKRNIIAHDYNVKIMEETIDYIRNHFFPLCRDLYHSLKKEYSE